MRSTTPIIPRNPDGKVRAIVLGRLSQAKETEEETNATIESSYLPVNDFLKRVVEGPIEVRYLGEQISGYIAERETMLEAWRLIETGEWDVVISEDLSRIYRNPRHQQAFVQDCVDADIRVICLADDLDTADENWEMMLGVGALRHGMHVPDTRRRSKRKALYSFHHGGMVQKVKFGYRKLTKEDADSGCFGPKGLRETKVPEATEILRRIRCLAMETGSAAAIVTWLIQEGIAPGPYVKGGWRVAILKSVLCDPKLHGWRLFKRTLSKTIYRSGKKRRSKNQTPEKMFVKELAHMTLEEQQSMVSALGWEIDWHGTTPKRSSPRRSVPRGRSLWPGQAATCAICGRERGMLIYGDHLRCRNSTKENGRKCWNHVQVPIGLTRKIVTSFLVEQLQRNPRVWAAMIDAAWIEYKQKLTRKESREADRQKKVHSLEEQQKRLANAIAQGGELQGLLSKLAEVESALKGVAAELQVEHSDENQLPRIDSREAVESRLPRLLEVLMNTSFGFADVMRKFFPVFMIQPVQALDSKQVWPRAKLQMQLPPGHPEAPGFKPVDLQFDLFDPPLHISLMPEIVSARNREPRPTYRQIATEVGTSYMTVKRALGYAQLMNQLGVDTPYVELGEAPKQASRWRNAS